jgi:hypothetical protein
MMRLPRMNVMRESLVLASLLLVFACGRNETMASKSASAYREAQAKRIPVTGGHEHGGHETATTTTGTEPMDHSAHGTAADPHAGHDMTASVDHSAHGSMSATDHAAMNHGTADPHAGHAAVGVAAMDHSAHGTMTAADHAAMGHGTASDAHTGHTTTAGAMDHSAHAAMTGTAADQHAGMQHGTSTPAANAHAGHGAKQQPGAGAPSVVLNAPTTNAEIARTQPAATLRPDDFDAPVPIAVEEAQKAAAGGGGHQGHGTPVPKKEK